MSRARKRRYSADTGSRGCKNAQGGCAPERGGAGGAHASSSQHGQGWVGRRSGGPPSRRWQLWQPHVARCATLVASARRFVGVVGSQLKLARRRATALSGAAVVSILLNADVMVVGGEAEDAAGDEVDSLQTARSIVGLHQVGLQQKSARAQ